ncbi:hypothetical protein KXR53_12245 [Inquilinus limosus]|uniref:HEPN domain-containing protein n=1 Tax=Inquilinus limosus TaxID=171674 RepID=UPI003F179D56
MVIIKIPVIVIPALDRLNIRLGDARRLIEIHEECTGNSRGRRHGYDALNRSAIILTVAAWEGFVEDLLQGAVGHIARKAASPSVIPENVRESMVTFLYEKNGWSKLNGTTKSEIWSLSGRGWRTKYIEYARHRANSLNTPNHDNIRKMYSSVLGLADCSANWGTGRWTTSKYVQKLEDLLTLRHKIAHGSIGEETVGKRLAKGSISLVEHIAKQTNRSVIQQVRRVISRPRKSS